MNEIATGPVSAVPLVTTHVDRVRSTEVVQEATVKAVEEVKVIDTYDFRGVISTATREHKVSWLV